MSIFLSIYTCYIVYSVLIAHRFCFETTEAKRGETKKVILEFGGGCHTLVHKFGELVSK